MRLQSLQHIESFVYIFLLKVLNILSLPASTDNGNIHVMKIINGTVADCYHAQHQVSIRKRRDDGYFFGTGHICGGTLISENVVLSAAHCFVDQILKNGSYVPIDKFVVVMGNLNRFEQDNTLTFDIQEAIFPQDTFNMDTYEEDIALLILNGSVSADHSTITPIMLNEGHVISDYVCQASGWGWTEQEELSDILLTVNLPIIDHDICCKNSEYGEGILDDMICAGYLSGQYDSCQGDSGGPLICDGLQVGIISWGNGCALPFQPGIYTNISYYKDWILEQVNMYEAVPPVFIKKNYTLNRSISRHVKVFSYQFVIFSLFGLVLN